MSGPPSTLEVARAVQWLATVAAVGALGTGLWLTVRYQPGRSEWVGTMHAAMSALAVTSALAAWVVQRRGRITFTPRGAAVVVGLTLALVTAVATGTGLAWEYVGTEASGVSGVFGLPDEGLTVDGRAVAGGAVAASYVVHVVAALVAADVFVVVLGSMRRSPSSRPRRRTDVRESA